MTKKRVYISGKMRGLKPEQFAPVFEKAKNFLESKGYEVVNPVDFEEEKMKTCECWADFIIFDLQILKTCNAIYMLQNWQDIWGAKVEFNFANGHGLEILYQEKPFPRIDEIKPVLVMELPKSVNDMKPGILYLKHNNDGTYESFHLCPCGCGEPVYLQYGGKGWDLKFSSVGAEGLSSVTINPSIGCFDIPCKSHYFIRNNKIVWV